MSQRTSSDDANPAASGFRAMISRSAIRPGEGSFRGLLTKGPFSRTMDRSPSGPRPHERGTAYYLEDEMQAARQAVQLLDEAVSDAQSFREAATRLLTEAHRALGRLEQSMDNREVAAELLGLACDIKCAAKRGITLVKVYGKLSTAVKIMTLFMRSYIHAKFDKQSELLRKLNPPMRPPHAGVGVGAGVGAAAAAAPGGGGGNAHVPLAAIPSSESQPVAGTVSLTTTVATAPSASAVLSGSLASTAEAPAAVALPPPTASAGGGSASAGGKSLGRNSLGTPQAAAAAAAASPQAAPPPSGPLVGKALQAARHEKVLALAYVPPGQVGPQSVDFPCIWWSTGPKLEFYNDATQSTTAFTQQVNATALAVDEAGSVWSGHVKGQVRVQPRQQWELWAEAKEFSTAIRVIAFDQEGAAAAASGCGSGEAGSGCGGGRAWVGDEAGRIKVLAYDPRVRQLAVAAVLQRGGALQAKMKAAGSASLFGKRHCQGAGVGAGGAGAQAAASAAAVIAVASAAANTVAAVAQAAIAGPAGRDGSPGGAALGTSAGGAGGGSDGKAISSNQLQSQGTMEGPVRCIFVRGGRVWASGGRSAAWLQLWDAETFQDIDVFDCCVFGPCHAMASLRWPASYSSAGPSYPPSNAGAGANPSSQHRHTHSDGSRLAAGSSFGSGGAPSWRLLTGHENGQLLLWHPEHRVLAPLLLIGEPGSPCRGIAAFDAYNLVVTGHQGGYLHLFLQPGAESGGLPPGSDSAAPQSLGTHRPKMATVTAHKSRLDRMAMGAASCATASILGTIRLWYAGELAQEAQRLGLMLSHTPSYGSLLGVIDSAQPFALPRHFSNASSTLHQRESGKALGTAADLPQHASGQLASPVGAAAGGGMLGTSYRGHHGRQGSKDGLDIGAQPGSGATTGGTPTTADTPVAASHTTTTTTGGGAPTSGASFPHLQTIEFNELRIIKAIGSGAYGEVLLADWMGSKVAVKRLFADGQLDSEEDAALVREVTLLGSLSHPNIVRFLAVCLDPPRIVMQYSSHGSLFNMLRNAQRGRAAKEMTWSKRLEMLRDVAAGMQYLHSRKPPVIHGDLRSPNLLLDLTIENERPRFHVKIADFGLARMATGTTGSVMVSKTTNPRWLAPEVMRNNAVGKAADVYSFAIIMWEMLTWRQPYQDMMSVQVLYSMANGDARPDVPPDSELPGSPGVSLPMYRQLMESCWQADAEARPSFKEIVEMFENMLRVEAESARQRRQQQQQAAGVLRRPHSGNPSETGPGPSQPNGGGGGADYGGSAAGEPAGLKANAPGSGGGGGSGDAALPAAAAMAAAARRTAATGVASPFSAGGLTPPGELQEGCAGAAPPEPGGGGINDVGGHGLQQYGSVLARCGMSPILEEAASATASPLSDEDGTAADAVATTVAAATTTPLQQQQHQHGHPHVHFAPSANPFSQVAVGGGESSQAVTPPVSSSCPASPSLSTRSRAVVGTGSASAGGPVANAPSSASSTESGGAVHAASGGSDIAGAPSTASSSRQSSASLSGRAIGGISAATASSTASAVGSGVRKVAGAPQAAGSGIPRGVAGATAQTRLAAAAAAAGHLCETYSIPVAPPPPFSITNLSPFASMPATQLSELDAAAPQLAAIASGSHLLGAAAAVGAGHVRAAAPPSPKHIAATSRGGGSSVAASCRPGTHTSGLSHVTTAGPVVVSGSRGRIPAPSMGPGPPPRAGGVGGSTPSGTPRSAAGSQPGTPPYRGPAAATSPPLGRGGGAASGHSSRPGSIPGFAAAAAGTPGRSHSGDGPASAGGRRTGPASACSTPGDDGAPLALSVSTHLSMAAARLSQSAAPPHVDGHEEGLGASGAPAGRPGHRRTPSGGTASSHPYHHLHASGGAAAGHGRAGDLLASAIAAVPYGHDVSAAQQHRSPVYASRGIPGRGCGGDGPASPRGSAPNAAPAAMPLARRNVVGPHSAAPFEAVASPSAPTSGHLSRLAAVAAAGSTAGRPPASPRSYIPSGQFSSSARSPSYNGGATIAAASGGDTGAERGASRIPSLAQSTSHGSGQLGSPAKSSTSRSLDDGNLRRLGLGLGQEAAATATLPAAGSAGASPPAAMPKAAAAVAAAASSLFGPVADAVWEDGLDAGVHHSPDITQDGECFRQSDEYHAQPISGADGQEEGGGGGDNGADRPVVLGAGAFSGDASSFAPPASLPRIATTGQCGTSEIAASELWRPPALLSAGGYNSSSSPSTAAAYNAPPFSSANSSHGADAAVGAAVNSEQQSGSAVRGRSGPSGDIAEVTSPTAPLAGSQLAVESALSDWSAAVPHSPFAQFATEPATWWEDQRQDG